MDLSIIILSYNTKDITDECLKRLQASVDRVQKKLKNNVESIVLDNASEDGSVELIEKKYPWVKLIKSKINTGFSRGNNIAMKQSNNPFVLFLNSDCFVEEDTLFKALSYFKDHPDCSVLGVKLVYENNKFQPSAGFLPNPLNAILWILGIPNSFHPRNKVFFEKDKQVGWVTGAFLMIKKEAWEKTSGFDENIFMYMDEVDLCKRINMEGFKICFTPDIVVTHLHRASSPAFPEKALVSELAGIGYYFKKYYSGVYPLVRLFLVLGLIFRVIAFSLLGKTKRARAYVEGLGVI
ncbi:MAG: glycosyltransferase family 2 protein [Candidatus Daviesbacteria bacterium]|nr:glycosyltransferase family 2 protein [Candidatus Daviesbacteria bacterium]